MSTDSQSSEGVSLEMQSEKIASYCALHGLPLGGLLVDAGESGKTLERPAMQELLARVRAGGVCAVVVYKLDRLTRSPRDLYCLVDDVLNSRNVDLVSVMERLDTRSPGGRAMLGMMSIFAQMERETIGERTRAALRYKRDKGERLGTTPLGYVTPGPGCPMEPLEAELVSVHRILALRGSGATFRAIALELTAEGLPTKRGGRWDAGTVRKVWLRRSRYEGKSQHSVNDSPVSFT